MYAYLGLSFGDVLSGWLSQIFRSRRKIVVVYLIACSLLVGVFLSTRQLPPPIFYALCFLIGTTSGYWALFVTIASEQFGTNIRATVTTTVPNFVRGAVVPITIGFKYLEPEYGNINSALIIGFICVSLAMVSILSISETFGKDLDYYETN